LAYVLGEHRPRRAARLGGPETASPEPGRSALRADDPVPATVELVEPGPRASSRFSRLHVGVVCTLVLLGLVFAVLAVLRARPVALATPQGSPVSVSTHPSNGTPAAASASSSARPRMVVHVLGAVRRPGLVRLPQGSRVQDAIEAAGGLRSSAAPGELNLAQILTDGQQIVIGSRGHPGGRLSDGGGGRAGSASSGSSPQIDLNSATASATGLLAGRRPVTAERIWPGRVSPKES